MILSILLVVLCLAAIVFSLQVLNLSPLASMFSLLVALALLAGFTYNVSADGREKGALEEACRSLVAQDAKPDLLVSCKAHLAVIDAQKQAQKTARQAEVDAANEALVRAKLQ